MQTVYIVHLEADYYAFSTEEKALEFVHSKGCVVNPILDNEDELLYWFIVDGEDYEINCGTMTKAVEVDSNIGG